MVSSSAESEVKLLYIEEQLSRHGKWLCDVFTSVLSDNHNIVTGDLQSSVNYAQLTDRGTPSLRFNFLSYGRAFEIAGYKKRNRLKSKVDTMQIAWGEKENRRPSGKRTKWYAPNMYGGYYKLVSKLMYGLSEMEIERLKDIIQQRKQQDI